MRASAAHSANTNKIVWLIMGPKSLNVRTSAAQARVAPERMEVRFTGIIPRLSIVGYPAGSACFFSTFPKAEVAGKIRDLITTGTAPEDSRIAPISM
jgi:hypothetical protein